MPAGITKDRYGTSFAITGEPAWHGLGNPIPQGASTREVLQAARLSNWNVRTVVFDALAYEEDDKYHENGMEIPLKEGNRRLVIRTNPDTGQQEVLGHVTHRYEPYSNEELAALADSIMEFDDGTYWDTAGAIHNNKVVFLSLKLGDEIIIDPSGANDRILQNVLLTSGHTGQIAVIAKNVGTRVVCANTYAIAMGEDTSTYTFRHLRGQVDQQHDIASALGLTRNYFKTLEEVANTLYETPMDKDGFVKFVDTLYPEPEVRDLGVTQGGELRKDRTHSMWETRKDHLVDIWNGTGERQVDTIDNIRGTAWAGYNAFTEYLDWYGSKQGSGSGRTSRLVQASSLSEAKILTLDGKSVDAKPYGLEVLKELVSS